MSDRMTNVNWYYHWTCASARRRRRGWSAKQVEVLNDLTMLRNGERTFGFDRVGTMVAA